jgi:hypothetical protein
MTTVLAAAIGPRLLVVTITANDARASGGICACGAPAGGSAGCGLHVAPRA